jgi:hypothetical protein
VGRFDLAVRADGYSEAVVPGVEVPSGEGDHELGTVTMERGLVLEGEVVDEDGRRLAGVVVRLVPGEERAYPARHETTTSSQGTFRFEDLRRGDEVQIEAELEGYLQVHEATLRLPSERPVRVVLESGAPVKGRVVSPEGAGVEGLVVQARLPTRAVTSYWLFGRSPQASSDSSGRFELRLTPGEWELTVHHDAWSAAPYPLELTRGDVLDDIVIELQPATVVVGTIVDPDGDPVVGAEVQLEATSASSSSSTSGPPSDAAGRYRVSLGGMDALSRPRSGEPPRFAVVVSHPGYRPARREFVRQPGENRIDVTLEPGLEIAGRVSGPDGEPVDGAMVHASLVEQTQRVRRVDETPARSDSAGRFALRGLEAGRYVLDARAEGYAQARSAPIELREASVGDVVLELQQGITLRGLVRGLSVDDLARVTVRAHPLESLVGYRVETLEYTARPDFEGRFEIGGLHAARWQLWGELGTLGSGRRAQEQIDVAAGDAPYVELSFGEGFALSGLVQLDGANAPGLRVFVHDGRSSFQNATTDVNGRFLFEGLEAGEHSVQVQHAGGSYMEKVAIDGDREIVIDLHPSRVSGRVVAAATGEPIAGARILAKGGEQAIVFAVGAAESAFDGSFSLELQEGQYTVAVSRSGFASGEVSLDVAAGAELAGLVVELEAASEVELLVALPSGAPAETLFVTLASSRVSAVGAIETERIAAGRFALRSLGLGTWDLLVGGNEGATFERVTVVAPGPPVAVQLRAAGSVQVTAASFSDVAAHVEIFDGAGARYEHPLASLLPLERGTGTVPALPVGIWRLRVVADDGRVAEATVMVEAGAIATVEIP